GRGWGSRFPRKSSIPLSPPVQPLLKLHSGESMRSLRGVIPILNSAFQDNGDLDLYSQEKLVEFLLESGVGGIALFGTASEGYTLSSAERESILKMVLNV